MQHSLQRSNVPGVVMTHEFGGRRPPRGIRRHNRKLIAQARRGYKALEVQEQNSSAAAANLDPWAYGYEVARLAKNERGDCPSCGQYGAHALKNFRLSPMGTPVELRQCWSCGANFSDLPKPATPPKEPGYDELPDSKESRYNDCPEDGCSKINVITYVVMRDAGRREVKVCKCSDGHLFKKGVNASEPSILWLPRSQRT